MVLSLGVEPRRGLRWRAGYGAFLSALELSGVRWHPTQSPRWRSNLRCRSGEATPGPRATGSYGVLPARAYSVVIGPARYAGVASLAAHNGIAAGRYLGSVPAPRPLPSLFFPCEPILRMRGRAAMTSRNYRGSDGNCWSFCLTFRRFAALRRSAGGSRQLPRQLLFSG